MRFVKSDQFIYEHAAANKKGEGVRMIWNYKRPLLQKFVGKCGKQNKRPQGTASQCQCQSNTPQLEIPDVPPSPADTHAHLTTPDLEGRSPIACGCETFCALLGLAGSSGFHPRSFSPAPTSPLDNHPSQGCQNGQRQNFTRRRQAPNMNGEKLQGIAAASIQKEHRTMRWASTRMGGRMSTIVRRRS